MQNYIAILKRSKLFSGVSEQEISSMLNCLDAKLRKYGKGEYVYRQGERISGLSVLTEGSLLIQKDDYWGNRTIVSRVDEGEMFGEAFIAPESGPVLNDVVAYKDSAVMFFDITKTLTVCSTACRFHSLVVQNLFYAISEKNRTLVQKIGHMSKRSTREKLISFLSEEAEKNGSPNFSISFNRQQLADFLCVDRSAMSNELCKMRDDGLLLFDKNNFTLLQTRKNNKAGVFTQFTL